MEPPRITKFLVDGNPITLRGEVIGDIAQKIVQVCRTQNPAPTPYEIYAALTTAMLSFLEITKLPEPPLEFIKAMLQKSTEEHRAEGLN